MSKWPRVPLESVLDFREGPGIMAVDFRNEGVPLLRLAGLKRDGSLLNGCNYLDPEMVAQRWSHFRLQEGDVLLSTSASLGEVAIVDESASGAVPYTGLIGFRPKDDRVEPAFIPLMLREQWFKDQIEAMGVGSVMKHFGPSHLRSMSVTLPPRPQQRAIAEVLSALDAKIAANSALAAASDGVGNTEFLKALSAADTVETALSSVAEVVLGGTPSRNVAEYWTGGRIAWLNSGAANATRVITPSEFITEEALARSAAKLMPVGATLVAITGATLGQIARLELVAAGNQSLVGVWNEVPAINDWLYFAIQRRVDLLLTRATGAAQQHVSKGDVESLFVPLPSRAVLDNFAAVASPLLHMAANAERENRTLAATREALLPQLMSGKIRVSDAERIAADAGA